MAKKDTNDKTESPYVGADPIENDQHGYVDPTDMPLAKSPEEKYQELLKEEGNTDEPVVASDDGDDADADVEAQGEADAEAQGDDANEPVHIPKSRFDEVNERRKRAEEENQRLKQQLEAKQAPAEPEPDPYDFDKAESEYQELLLDGETDKALALRKEIRAEERRQLELELRATVSESANVSKAAIEFEQVAEEAAEIYEVYNTESQNYDQALVDETLELKDAYVGTGKFSHAQALEKAVNIKALEYGLAKPAQPERQGLAAKTPDVATKASASKQQPPSVKTQNSGKREMEQPSIGQMSDKEFASLPESAKRRLRGDFITH